METKQTEKCEVVNDSSIQIWEKYGKERAYHNNDYVNLKTGEIHGDSFRKKGDTIEVFVEQVQRWVEAIKVNE